ncbi:Cacna1s [Symbiodinium natans]|uniref:Cacna1s protein n=1 Tax=Symbiodinium natans TaxID=878477 RepID=A0A812R664_9DINO|nr:Cacna1s [Symbiodinium natans]
MEVQMMATKYKLATAVNGVQNYSEEGTEASHQIAVEPVGKVPSASLTPHLEDHEKLEKVADPAKQKNVRQRLQVRLNILSSQQLVTGKNLHDAVTSLGLTTYAVEDMNDLVNEMAAFISLRFVKQQESQLNRGWSSNSVFSAQEHGDLGKAVWQWPSERMGSMRKGSQSELAGSIDEHRTYDFNVVPAKALMDIFLHKDAELHRRLFHPRLLTQFQAMREILLAGDTNKLVAELTFVRINDLAAPPEAVDALFYIEPMVAILILVNGIMIGFQTDPNFEHWSGWPYVELIFAILLVLECCLRVWLSGGLRGFFCSAERLWNVFDLFLVCTAITDVSFQLFMQEGSDMFGASLLRFCRLIRLVRVVKVFRLNYMKELRLMVKGLVGGIRTLLLSFALLFAVLYVIAGFATMTIGRYHRTPGDLQGHFENIPQSMFTSFRCFSGECFANSGAPIASVMSSVFGWPFVLSYVLSYMLVSMGIFNVILAVYVDITMRAAKETEATTAEQYARESIRIARTTRELLKKFAEAYRLFHDTRDEDKSRLNFGTSSFTDEDIRHNIAITKELFLLVIQDQNVQKLMNDLDLPSDRANLFEVIDADGSGTLHVTELVQGLLKIRGELTKSDTVATHLKTQAIQGMLADLKDEQAQFRDVVLHSMAALASVYQVASVAEGRRVSEAPLEDPKVIDLDGALRPDPVPNTAFTQDAANGRGLDNVLSRKPPMPSSAPEGAFPNLQSAEVSELQSPKSVVSTGSRCRDI